MGRALLIGLLAAATLGCGDAIVAIGDHPGFMRIAAGTSPTNGLFLYDPVATRARFARPAGVAADSAGNLYLADQAAAIVRVNAAGQLKVLLSSIGCADNTCLWHPQSIALTTDGSALLIADDRSNKLWKLTIASGELQVANGNLAEPTGIVVLNDGRILVSERSADRISAIGTNGVATTFATGLNGPAGLAISGGTLFVAESRSHTIRAIDLSNGAKRLIAGTGAAGFSGDGALATAAALNTPWALAASGANLYVADQANHRVRVINTETGLIGTFAGTGSRTFTGNGRSAAETSLSTPNGLVVSPLGFLYIADADHGVIWRTPIRLI